MSFHVFLLLLLVPQVLALLQDEQNNVEVYQRCNPSVVNITAVTLRRDFFMELYPQKGVGSGFIIRPDGYIVTNDHVIGRAPDVQVTLFDKSEFPAKVVGRDSDADIAVLKIDPKGKKLLALEFQASDSVAVGQKVLAIGNPFGLGGSLSVGVVSSLGRDIRAAPDRPVVKEVIQTDAAINPGNSGGPLLDSTGKIIGVSAQILSRSGGSEGVGFAISVKFVKPIVNQLIQFGKVLRPWIGFEGVGFGPDLLENLKIPLENGVMITDIFEQSPAAKADLRPASKVLVWGFREIPYGGDVIYQVDGTPVSTFRDILDVLFDKKPGDVVQIHLLRGRVKRVVSVKLTLPPGSRGKGI